MCNLTGPRSYFWKKNMKILCYGYIFRICLKQKKFLCNFGSIYHFWYVQHACLPFWTRSQSGHHVLVIFLCVFMGMLERIRRVSYTSLIFHYPGHIQIVDTRRKTRNASLLFSLLFYSSYIFAQTHILKINDMYL